MTTRYSTRCRVPLPSLLCAVLCLSALAGGPRPATAQARAESSPDTVAVEGVPLAGRITRVEPNGLSFETEYGSGSIVIEWARVTAVTSSSPFHLVDSSHREYAGQIEGLQSGRLTIRDGGGSLSSVALGTIVRGLPEDDFRASLLERIHARYPWWKAALDLSGELEETAYDKLKLKTGINVERRRRPTRLVFDARYTFERQGQRGQPKRDTKDEFRAFVLFEHDLGPAWNVFAYPAVEWDRPRDVSLRIYPALGAGYRFVDGADALLMLQLGSGWVLEDIEGFGRDDYVAGYVGVEARKTWSHLHLRLRSFYMPAYQNAGEQWLLRTEVDTRVPVTDFFALNLRLTEVSDNNPAPTAGTNKFVTSFGLTLHF